LHAQHHGRHVRDVNHAPRVSALERELQVQRIQVQR
jgi:hypothetical protein